MKEEMTAKIFKSGLDSIVITYVLKKIYEDHGHDATKSLIESHCHEQIPSGMSKGEELFLGNLVPSKSDIDPLICQLMNDLKG